MRLTVKKVMENLGIDSSTICKMCFEETDVPQYFKCKICNVSRKNTAGYSNLTSHLEDKHIDTLQDYCKGLQKGRKGPMNSYTRALSKDAQDYHDWIEWVVMCDEPFTFVEDKYTRKHARLSSISRHTLMEYANAVISSRLLAK